MPIYRGHGNSKRNKKCCKTPCTHTRARVR